jgi:hypothetical protein
VRRLGGLALIVLGVAGMLAGCLLAVSFGPDDRMGTGPHRLTSPGPAIATAPEALAYSGPRVQLTVTSTDRDRQLFVGVGHDVDVSDFLAGTPHTRVQTIDIPWRVSVVRVPGDGPPEAAPGRLAWWTAEARGRGRAVLTWRLPDSASDVVILGGGAARLAVDVTAALLVPGVFVVGLAAVVIGLGVGVFGWAVLTTRVTPVGAHALRPLRPRHSSRRPRPPRSSSRSAGGAR